MKINSMETSLMESDLIEYLKQSGENEVSTKTVLAWAQKKYVKSCVSDVIPKLEATIKKLETENIVKTNDHWITLFLFRK